MCCYHVARTRYKLYKLHCSLKCKAKIKYKKQLYCIASYKIFLNSCILYYKCEQNHQICLKGSYRYTHSFKSHFSRPFDRYSNRLTVYTYSIAKASTVYFYWGLIHVPDWCPQVLGWSVNGSNFPGKLLHAFLIWIF